MASHRNAASSSRQRLLRLLGKLVCVALAACAAGISFPFARCPDNAMAPSIRQGDLCLACRWSKPEYLRAVIYTQGDRLLVGRVIATAGQNVEAEIGMLLIDGTPYPCKSSQLKREAQQVPQDSVFIVSDNATDRDSLTVGPIPESLVKGTVVWQFRCRDI